MHHDPLLSSRKRVHVSWGHDWVILSLLIPNPPWSPTKVWALPVGMRLYRNRQGLTKGKKGQARGKKAKKRPLDPNHRTRPELAVELIARFAGLFPHRRMVVSGDSAYGGKSVCRHLPENVDLISRVASNAALYEPAPPRSPKQRGPSRKKGARLPWDGRSGRLTRPSPGRRSSSTSMGCTRSSRSRRSGPCTTRRARTGC